MVFPDTSPRGANIEGEDESWDFGTGAGFYVDATQAPWNKNYNMYSYIHKELQSELAKKFAELDFTNVALTGHSMGGLGAIAGFLKNPGQYKSISAFAPISNPTKAPWGEKCFTNYLGPEISHWQEYDPVHLIQKYTNENQPTILIHQGSKDSFYYEQKQLLPENLVQAAKQAGYKGGVDLNVVDGYDHSYFFCQFIRGTPC
jgi:S-formylglutathione hydrolase